MSTNSLKELLVKFSASPIFEREMRVIAVAFGQVENAPILVQLVDRLHFVVAELEAENVAVLDDAFSFH